MPNALGQREFAVRRRNKKITIKMGEWLSGVVCDALDIEWTDSLDSQVIFGNIDALQRISHKHLEPFTTSMLDLMRTNQPKIDARIKRGVIAFRDIPHVFSCGTLIRSERFEKPYIAEVKSVSRRRAFFGDMYDIKMQVIFVDQRGPRFGTIDTTIPEFSGVKSLDAMPLKPAPKELLEECAKNGKAILQRGFPFYGKYSGQMYRPSWWFTEVFDAKGRVMVDPACMARFEEQAYDNYVRSFRDYDSDGNDQTVEAVPKKFHSIVYPFIPGFSFSNKRWGLMYAPDIENIVFRDDAIDKLVLDPAKKEMIVSLVQNAGLSFADLIENKGGGVIFLLHGPPGTGKTLTAEAVAEYLKRPLYSISVGELGTTPEELEDRLQMILTVAEVWNAVVLLDEGDIFLEKRSDDIERNAMIGVFLRMLEYHQGVMFITTNRVKQFDPAFYSRISLALHYDKIDTDTRGKIIASLADAAGIPMRSIPVKEMVRQDINGRQVKNIIRLAQTLAASEKRRVSQRHFKTVMSVSGQFNTQIDMNEEEP